MVIELRGHFQPYLTVNNGREVYKLRRKYFDSETGKSFLVNGLGYTAKLATENCEKNLQKRLTKMGYTGSVEEKTTPKPLPKSGLTIEKYLPSYQALQGNTVKEQSKRTRRHSLERWVIPYFPQPMNQIRREDIQLHFYSTLPALTGPTAVYTAYASMRALLNSAIASGRLKDSPMAGLKAPKTKALVDADDSRYMAARTAIFKGLLKELSDPNHPNHEFYPLWLLSSFGLRKSELLGLEWSSFTGLGRAGKAKIHITQQLIGPENGFHIQDSTKTEKPRSFSLPEVARKALLERKSENRVGKEEWSRDLVFVSPSGLFMDYNRYNRAWKKCLGEYIRKDGRKPKKYESWRPHTNRKIAASILAANNTPMKTAMEILGHSSITMSLYYMKSDEAQKQEAAAAMAAAYGLN